MKKNRVRKSRDTALSHVLSQLTTQGFPFFACQNDAAGAALKKAAPALGSGQPKNRLRLHTKSGGFRRLWLRNTADWGELLY